MTFTFFGLSRTGHPRVENRRAKDQRRTFPAEAIRFQLENLADRGTHLLWRGRRRAGGLHALEQTRLRHLLTRQRADQTLVGLLDRKCLWRLCGKCTHLLWN
ncbi:MAG: hypothetical protein MZV64_23075 [Ignavibacteriales bacterium]|nr:hypothetical protein [Ignavibacteriales bacterium]